MKYFYLVPVASVVALIVAYYFFKQMMKKSEGSEKMKSIAGYIRDGAMSYLKQQYKVVIIVFIILALIFTVMAQFHILNNNTKLVYLFL